MAFPADRHSRLKYIGAAINGTADDPFPFSPWYAVLPAMLATFLIGPVEENRVARSGAPPAATSIRTFVGRPYPGRGWGLWHFPAFLLSGTPQSAWSFGPYWIGVLALGVLVTPMFNASRGSILIPMLFHFQMNNPLWPEAQPWENYLFLIAATVIVIIARRSMLHRDGAVTDVLMPAHDRTSSNVSTAGHRSAA